ncbi:hypothetical protein GO013_10930 [Pseudodesulfovibrio sp. JC047]|uniref:GNAT family N-acetyltransferase n=1 Tax=Pseudodesulfovibrio sp. JC047 TaxID=2683199 RepID=UPI0013D655D0|nr:GNAT family N-acetyltransferase [Pseudodesulfovibrio sp. JC047]NDV19935.1 hypothetical protein [Pseudodesulfovibrio sp. JC047]
MKQQTEFSKTIFLAKLTLPVRTLMTRSAVDCAAHVAKILSFDEKGIFGIKLAVDEAFCNAVEHFSGVITPDERIHIEFFIEDDMLVISIREKGIPFDRRQAERYTPESLDTMNKPGLGTLLMHQSMDSVELFVHGRDGKETRLKKRLAYGALPPELVESTADRQGKKRITVKNPDIRLTSPDELAEVCRLAWRCYGFTQEDFLYDLDALTQKIKRHEFTSVTAFDPESGAMIGHAGFKYHDPAVKVPELGLAFVDPTYRSPGLPKKLARLLFDIAEQEGDRGIFDCSVTTHTFSQKGMQEMGSRPCSLLMGIAASGMQAKELATSRQEKGSVMSHYYAFDRTPKTLFIPTRHRDMIAEIYTWLDLPRTFEAGSSQPLIEKSSVTVFPLPDELNVAFITVHTIGSTTRQEIVEGFRQCENARHDAVYILLPLGVPASPDVVADCEDLGFSFAGIMPHVHDGDDRILMQRVHIELDMDAIKVYGDMSKTLFSYIRKERERVSATVT